MSEDEYTHRQFFERKEKWLDYQLWLAMQTFQEDAKKFYEMIFRKDEKDFKNNKNRV